MGQPTAGPDTKRQALESRAVLAEAIGARREEVLAQAVQTLHRSHLVHMEAVGARETRNRLLHLLDLVVTSLTAGDVGPIGRYARDVAYARYNAGFDIAEVQVAFNVLEEAIWQIVIPRLPFEDLVLATASVGTVFGVGKDLLAQTWVALAASHHATAVDTSALSRR